MVSVEIAGPHPPPTYAVVPDAVGSLASHIINECVGRAHGQGGFATMDIGRIVDYVVDPKKDLEEYRMCYLFLSILSSTFYINRRRTHDIIFY